MAKKKRIETMGIVAQLENGMDWVWRVGEETYRWNAMGLCMHEACGMLVCQAATLTSAMAFTVGLHAGYARHADHAAVSSPVTSEPKDNGQPAPQ